MSEQKRIFDIQLEILNNELKSIDGAIRQHDELAKSVKNWAVVTWTASIGFALKEAPLHPYLWLTAIIPLVFWLADGSFRRIQRSFIARVQQVSNYFNSESFRHSALTGNPIEIPLLVMRIKTGQLKDSMLGTMFFRSVALLYIGLATISIAVWVAKRL